MTEGPDTGAGEKVYTTPDIGAAAFCMEEGRLELLKAEKLPGGNFKFVLKDLEGQGDILLLKYANSPQQRFDARVRAIKKLLYGR